MISTLPAIAPEATSLCSSVMNSRTESTKTLVALEEVGEIESTLREEGAGGAPVIVAEVAAGSPTAMRIPPSA